VRPLSLIREAFLALVAPAVIALALLVCYQEIHRPAGAGVTGGALGGVVPISINKGPWWALIAAVLVVVWLSARAIGKPRGVLWGMWRWGVRAGLWWSAVALLIFIGVVIHGTGSRSMADLNWGFAVVYLVVMVAVLMICWIGRART
jgi:hypothetical protein